MTESFSTDCSFLYFFYCRHDILHVFVYTGHCSMHAHNQKCIHVYISRYIIRCILCDSGKHCGNKNTYIHTFSLYEVVKGSDSTQIYILVCQCFFFYYRLKFFYCRLEENYYCIQMKLSCCDLLSSWASAFLMGSCNLPCVNAFPVWPSGTFCNLPLVL